MFSVQSCSRVRVVVRTCSKTLWLTLVPNAVLNHLFRESVLQAVQSIASNIVGNQRAADFK